MIDTVTVRRGLVCQRVCDDAELAWERRVFVKEDCHLLPVVYPRVRHVVLFAGRIIEE